MGYGIRYSLKSDKHVAGRTSDLTADKVSSVVLGALSGGDQVSVGGWRRVEVLREQIGIGSDRGLTPVVSVARRRVAPAAVTLETVNEITVCTQDTVTYSQDSSLGSVVGSVLASYADWSYGSVSVAEIPSLSANASPAAPSTPPLVESRVYCRSTL